MHEMTEFSHFTENYSPIVLYKYFFISLVAPNIRPKRSDWAEPELSNCVTEISIEPQERKNSNSDSQLVLFLKQKTWTPRHRLIDYPLRHDLLQLKTNKRATNNNFTSWQSYATFFSPPLHFTELLFLFEFSFGVSPFWPLFSLNGLSFDQQLFNQARASPSFCCIETQHCRHFAITSVACCRILNWASFCRRIVSVQRVTIFRYAKKNRKEFVCPEHDTEQQQQPF